MNLREARNIIYSKCANNLWGGVNTMKKILTVLLAAMLVFTVVSCSLFMEEKDNSGSLVSFRLNTKGAKDEKVYGAEEIITYGESTVQYGKWASVDWKIMYVVTAADATTPTSVASYTNLYSAPFRVQKGQRVWAYCENTSATSINAPVDSNNTTITSLLKAEGLFKGTADAVVKDTKTFIYLAPELDEEVAFSATTSTDMTGNVKIISLKYILSNYQRDVLTTASNVKKLRVKVTVDGVTTTCDAEFTTNLDGSYKEALFENILVENVYVSKSATTPSNVKLEFVGLNDNNQPEEFPGANEGEEFNVFELSTSAQNGGVANIYVINSLTTEFAFITVENKEIRLALVELAVTTESNFTGDGDSMPNYPSVALVSDKSRYLSITDLRDLTTVTDSKVTIGNGTVKRSGTDYVYENTTGPAQHVAIVTAGQNLYVNAPKDTVEHFGDAEVIDISAVANNSFHEFGQAKEVKLAAGRFVAESGSKVEKLAVTSDTALVALAQGSGVKAIDLPVSYTSVIQIESVSGTYIPVVKKGNNYVTPSDIITGEGVTDVPSTLPVAKITNGTSVERSFNSLADAVADVKDNETIEMSASANISSTLLFSANNITLNLNNNNITANGVRAIQVKEGSMTITGSGTISSTDNIDENSSVIRVGDAVNKAAKLTVDTSVTVSTNKCYGITVFNGSKTNHASANVELILKGTVSSTNVPAISGTGNSFNGPTYITVESGAKVSTSNENAIYFPCAGRLTIKGTVEGMGGIEMKSGEAVVDKADVNIEGSAKIKATAQSQTHAMNNNGCSTKGYAIAVVENSGYKGRPVVTIKAGVSIEGKIAVVRDNDVAENNKGKIISFISPTDLVDTNVSDITGSEPGSWTITSKSTN